MSKPFSFRDMIVVDQTEGSWNDAIGLIAYQYKKRRRGIIGESHDACAECDEDPCACDESFEAQFDAMTPTDEEETVDEATLSREQEMAKNSDFDRVMAGAMKRDDYNKKWKLGQYKPAAGSSFIAHMLSQPVKKKV